MEIPYQEGVRFHFVAEGAICMLTAGREPLWLEAGDVVLLPHGTGHIIADEPRRKPQPLKDMRRNSWATPLTALPAVEAARAH